MAGPTIRDWTKYKQLLKSLLPRGRAWNTDDPVLDQTLGGKSVELARVDSRLNDLWNERDTRTTNEAVTDWEAEYAVTAANSLSQRQTNLNNALKAMGSMCKPYYITNAMSLFSLPITIDEFQPFWCNVNTCGQPCGDWFVMTIFRVNVSYTTSGMTSGVFNAALVKLQAWITLRAPANSSQIYRIV